MSALPGASVTLSMIHRPIVARRVAMASKPVPSSAASCSRVMDVSELRSLNISLWLAPVLPAVASSAQCQFVRFRVLSAVQPLKSSLSELGAVVNTSSS